MPSLESVRRIIGKGIVQQYIDNSNEGGESMVESGNFTGGIGDISLDFEPKIVIIIFETDTDEVKSYFVTNEVELKFTNYNILDYNNTIKTVTKQQLNYGARRDFSLLGEYIEYDTEDGGGLFIAIG